MHACLPLLRRSNEPIACELSGMGDWSFGIWFNRGGWPSRGHPSLELLSPACSSSRGFFTGPYDFQTFEQFLQIDDGVG